MSIGSRIKALRKQMNYTQEYVAEQLNVSRQAVSKWEKDISNPDTGNIIKLAGLLNSSVEYIASGRSENSEVSSEKPPLKRQKSAFYITFATILFLISCFCVVFYIHTRPVSWDSGACGGGYATWIFDKYSDKLTESFLKGMGEEGEKVISIKAIKGTQNAEWKDRQIFLEFDVEYKHEDDGVIIEKISFTGTRYWIESFNWSGAVIVG